jgi:hypothetical protein
MGWRPEFVPEPLAGIIKGDSDPAGHHVPSGVTCITINLKLSGSIRARADALLGFPCSASPCLDDSKHYWGVTMRSGKLSAPVARVACRTSLTAT